jgi:hypothetical protein
MPSQFRNLFALTLLSVACHPPNDFGAVTPGPRGVVDTPVRDYPFGDAVEVYRAALDLLYTDGGERPRIIAMYDSVFARAVGAQCPKCPRFGPHKARIDTSTIEGFATLPPVQPRLRKFGYKVPITFLSNQESAEMWRAGQAYDAAHPARPGEMPDGMDREFLRRYPGAWGSIAFSLVGFDRAHTEALLEIRQGCGAGCYSDEVVFFRKEEGGWRPIERVPRQVHTTSVHNDLHYRGPTGENPSQSELLVDEQGTPLRPDSKNAPSVYRAVLDSLYSFYGERPRMIVISGRHAIGGNGLPPHESHVDSSTIAAYNFLSAIADRMNPTFTYGVPIAVLSYESKQALDLEGIPLEKEANLHFANEETSGFWLAFRNRFPGAWGYVELSRIAYNSEHTQALVHSIHRCGSRCESGDTWLLRRDSETWSVADRMHGDDAAGWALDSLRYIGRGADPKWYRSRRAQGVFSNAETGAVLPFLNVTFERGHEFLTTIKTDSAGRYTLENLPLSSDLYFKVKCPIPTRTDTLAGPFLMTRAGLDTTVNIQVRYRGCKHLNRAHPLIAGTRRTSTARGSSRLSPEVAGVYRGLLDALYPPSLSERGPVMLEGFTSRRCDYCIESEVPRLIRKGLIDPSTEANFAKVPADTSPPAPFPYRRKVEVMPLWDLYWLGSSGGRQWDVMKDAYPGVNAVISFSGVGFNDRGTEALLEVHVDSARAAMGSETILLKKTDAKWNVALRHVEREATSGEWIGGKCEPTDAPAHVPAHAEMEKLVGEFSIVRVGASKVFRGRADTVRVRLEALKPSPNRPNELVAGASVIDATGAPDEKIAGTFELDEDAATITFTQRMPKGQLMLDGWIEWYKILRTSGRGFFGTWFTESGPTIPWRGYFCASAARMH